MQNFESPELPENPDSRIHLELHVPGVTRTPGSRESPGAETKNKLRAFVNYFDEF